MTRNRCLEHLYHRFFARNSHSDSIASPLPSACRCGCPLSPEISHDRHSFGDTRHSTGRSCWEVAPRSCVGRCGHPPSPYTSLSERSMWRPCSASLLRCPSHPPVTLSPSCSESSISSSPYAGR
ncbi:hypothetical protein CPC08DRAFT_217458 [Agrocybe pediades]|nr:hypothetical protein CPC08DRAFT_217458 [Agrocybe pediades]